MVKGWFFRWVQMAMCYRVKSLDLSRWESTWQECQSWDLVWMTKYSLKLPAVSKNTRFWSVPASLLHLKKTTNKQTKGKAHLTCLNSVVSWRTVCTENIEKHFSILIGSCQRPFLIQGKFSWYLLVQRQWKGGLIIVHALQCSSEVVNLFHLLFMYKYQSPGSIFPFLLQTRGYVLSLAKLKAPVHDVPYLCFQWFGKS